MYNNSSIIWKKNVFNLKNIFDIDMTTFVYHFSNNKLTFKLLIQKKDLKKKEEERD
jgi:hypothetical protein